MKATVERQRFGRYSARSTAGPKPGRSDVIVTCLDEGVARVRLARVREQKGMFMGAPMVVETSTYLDGTVVTATITGNKTTYERSTMGAAAIPLRSKDVTDFGRLEHAVKTLVGQMTEFGPENPPSAEQQEALVGAYQGILSWQEKARSQMARAEGQIDVAARMLREVMA